MENKINIAELLKDCPKGMELDCALYNKVTLLSVDDREDIIFPIIVMREDGYTLTLTKYGQYTGLYFAKCIIFPKGKTTWEGFVPPCKFKDGDIVVGSNNWCSYIAIYKEFRDKTSFYCHAVYNSFGEFATNDYSDNLNLLFANEREKEKLFDAIKDNGYKWNEETKSLEKLIPDKFGINTLKPFDKVLVRDSDKNMWCASIFSHTWKDKYFCVGVWHNQCIPYEANKELLGTTDNCNEYYKTWK